LGPAVITSTPSVLITDDDRGFRDAIRDLLAPQGFQTLTAADGEEALDIVLHSPVHLLLLDMHMPKLSGLETIRRIKQIRAILPCILISADADDALIAEALAAQAFAVLAKPVSTIKVTHTVHAALRRTYNWPGDRQLSPE
jgi:CheY-like chemotaxis protein